MIATRELHIFGKNNRSVGIKRDKLKDKILHEDFLIFVKSNITREKLYN